tara:strand:+ start:236 stop:676 length:441 start_codon:yes stop_codon:yes gene_type:complete
MNESQRLEKNRRERERYAKLSPEEKKARSKRNNIITRKTKSKWYQKNKVEILEKINGQYENNRKLIIEQLGGVCSHPECNCTEDLQLDHINPLEKEYNISERLSSWDIKKLQSEIDKCQLLCPKHHLEKTIKDGKKYGFKNRRKKS